ncbi:MAG: radical SAM protein, partial [Clostridia bacterium]|nr:radical SAM protein [Clostridia bacterium]
GASVTVTTANIKEVVSPAFLNTLQERGCKVVFYVEYVPVSEQSKALAPTDEERAFLSWQIMALREDYPEMLFLSFPGDEKSSGGCLAAGRGFSTSIHTAGQSPVPSRPIPTSMCATPR